MQPAVGFSDKKLIMVLSGNGCLPKPFSGVDSADYEGYLYIQLQRLTFALTCLPQTHRLHPDTDIRLVAYS